MNRRNMVLVAFASFQIWLIAASVDGSCPTYDINDTFEQSSTVFVGRAVAQRIVTASATRHQRETTFEVSTIWKGDVKRTVPVRNWACGPGVAAERGETVICSEDLHFRVDSSYLVFAAGTPLETAACGPTDELERARRTLEWLADKPVKNAR